MVFPFFFCSTKIKTPQLIFCLPPVLPWPQVWWFGACTAVCCLQGAEQREVLVHVLFCLISCLEFWQMDCEEKEPGKMSVRLDCSAFVKAKLTYIVFLCCCSCHPYLPGIVWRSKTQRREKEEENTSARKPRTAIWITKHSWTTTKHKKNTPLHPPPKASLCSQTTVGRPSPNFRGFGCLLEFTLSWRCFGSWRKVLVWGFLFSRYFKVNMDSHLLWDVWKAKKQQISCSLQLDEASFHLTLRQSERCGAWIGAHGATLWVVGWWGG